MLQAAVTESLVRRDPDGGFVARLAVEVPTIANGGARIVTDAASPSGRLVATFALRDDARWQDGEPITADDVRFAFEDDRAAPQTTAATLDGRSRRARRPRRRPYGPLHVSGGGAVGPLSARRARAAGARPRERDARQARAVRARADARGAVRGRGVDPRIRHDADRVPALRRRSRRRWGGSRSASTATAARSSTRCGAARSMSPARPRSRPTSRARSTASPTARAFRRCTSPRTASTCCASEPRERCSPTSACVRPWSSRSIAARWSRRSSPDALAFRARISSRRCRRRREPLEPPRLDRDGARALLAACRFPRRTARHPRARRRADDRHAPGRDGFAGAHRGRAASLRRSRDRRHRGDGPRALARGRARRGRARRVRPRARAGAHRRSAARVGALPGSRRPVVRRAARRCRRGSGVR